MQPGSYWVTIECEDGEIIKTNAWYVWDYYDYSYGDGMYDLHNVNYWELYGGWEDFPVGWKVIDFIKCK